MKNKIIILDVETGGLKYKENPITQIGLVVVEPKNFSIIEQYETFVKPYAGLEITTKALEVSRVSIEEINNGLDHVKALAKLIEIFHKHSEPRQKVVLVGHNFSFDIRFLQELFDLKSKDLFDFIDPVYWCTMRMMKLYERKLKSDQAYDLTACCSRFGIKLKAAHGALPDVLATRELLKSLMNVLDSSKNSGQSESSDKDEKPLKSRNFFELP